MPREITFINGAIWPLLLLLPLTSCDQTVSDPPVGEVESVEVVYSETTVTIDLADVEAVSLDDGESYSRLSDIVEAADLGAAPAGLEFDFQGSDGYRPSSRSTCVEHIPAPWEWMDRGYVHRTNRNMYWNEALEMPGCSHVDEMIRIIAIDPGTLRHEVDVVYGDTTVTVDLRDLDLIERDGADRVRLSDIVGWADLGVALANLEFNFQASDGFRPSDSDNCVDFVPVPGPALHDGYLSFDGLNLTWDGSLDLPGCLDVDDVVRIEALDQTPTGPTIEVSYLGEMAVVDLADAEVVLHEGTDHVRVADVIELAAFGVELPSVLIDFVATDGYRPSNNATCGELFPMAGAGVEQGFIELSTGNLSWATAAGLPGCAYVGDVALIELDEAGTGDAPFIDVIHGETAVTIDLAGLEAGSFLGQPAVSLLAVVEAAELVVATTALEFDFVASDGYRSTSSPSCDGIAPVPGAQLGDGYIILETTNLEWTEASGMPGCVRVHELAQIEALDP